MIDMRNSTLYFTYIKPEFIYFKFFS